ncbi:MAG: alpha/beta fold hydrolase [Sciscionella sp.]
MHARELLVGAGGACLGLLEAGPVDAPPLVLLHGWAQAAEVWRLQLLGALAASRRVVAVDLRGHGRSWIPDGGYDDPRAWADELRAVLEDLGRPAVVAGWSYGGVVITDYLRTFGDVLLAGSVLVGAITEIGRGRKGGRVGTVMRAALPDANSDDLAVALPAVVGFVREMTAVPLSGRWTQLLVGNALRVPPPVRAALFDRTVDSAEVLATCTVPTLVLHGAEDPVVDISAAEYNAGAIPGARLHWMDGVGHLPFVERPAEFDAVVSEFAADCFATRGTSSARGGR